MNIKKFITGVLIVLMILSVNLVSFAEEPDGTETVGLSASSIKGLTGQDSELSNKVGANAMNVIGAIRLIGIVAAVILLIMLAIKYVSAAPSEKADIKKSAIIYITGAIILFAASGILTIIQTFSKDFAK